MSDFDPHSPEASGFNSPPERIAAPKRKRKSVVISVEILNDRFAAAWIDVCTECGKVAKMRVLRQTVPDNGNDIATTHCLRHIPKQVKVFLHQFTMELPA